MVYPIIVVYRYVDDCVYKVVCNFVSDSLQVPQQKCPAL